jgi:hypothetical protein
VVTHADVKLVAQPVERWFREIIDTAIRRVRYSMPDLMDTTETCANADNDDSEYFA